MNSLEKFKNTVNEIQHLTLDCWIELEAKLYEKWISPDNYFSKENSFAQEIGFVISGVLRMFYLDDKGLEWNKRFLIENDFVMANMNPIEKSIISIQAITETKLICLQYRDFARLSKKYSELSLLTQKLTSQHIDFKQHREIRLLSMKARERYVNFLQEYPTLKKEIAQYHISSYLGITPTQLSRIKKELDEDQQM